MHPNCSESLSSSQPSPPPLFLRSPESPSLSPLTAGSHPLVQDQFLLGQSGGATTRRDPTTRVPPHWIEDPAAAPRYRKPADHWTSRRYSLLSSFRPLPSPLLARLPRGRSARRNFRRAARSESELTSIPTLSFCLNRILLRFDHPLSSHLCSKRKIIFNFSQMRVYF